MTELEYLKELISIKSYELNENKEIITYLKNKFEGVVSEIITIKNTVNQRENLLIGLNCKLKNVKDAVVLSGHVDTVFPAQTNPNSFDANDPTIIGDKLYGLGSIDMKSFWAVILNNASTLAKTSVPIILSITSDEETSIQGVELIVAKMKELNIVPKCVVVGEPTSSQICSSSKGISEYKIEIEGKSCHSSTPKNGVNANYILANLVLLIECLCYKYPETTCTCNVICGGNASNIVSDKASMQFDIRTSNKKYEKAIMDKINKKIDELLIKYNGAKIKVLNCYTVPPLEKKNADLINKICKEFNKLEVPFTGACEGGYFQEICNNAFIYGVGDLALCHQPNEHAKISEFLSYNKNFVEFVTKIAGML